MSHIGFFVAKYVPSLYIDDRKFEDTKMRDANLQTRPLTSAILSYLDQGRSATASLESMDPILASDSVVSASVQLLSSAAKALLIFGGDILQQDEPIHSERPSENGLLQHG